MKRVIIRKMEARLGPKPCFRVSYTPDIVLHETLRQLLHFRHQFGLQTSQAQCFDLKPGMPTVHMVYNGHANPQLLGGGWWG